MNRSAKNTAFVLAIFFAFFMLSSLPVFSLPGGVPYGTERDVYEPEDTGRPQKVTLRLNSSQQGKLFLDRSQSIVSVFPVYALILLAVPRLSFYPLFYLMKKRILLRPIKFTSMYVDLFQALFFRQYHGLVIMNWRLKANES